MPLITDQLGRNISISLPPKRIVSVVPSQTEFLFDLGLEDAVVGITKFCIHPADWFKSKQKVGGTKQLKFDEIRKLNPELVIANKEENTKTQIEELEKEFPIWISDINNLDSACQMMEQIGSLVNKEARSKDIISKIKMGFQGIPHSKLRLKAIYLIWQKPYMTIGGDTFIHSILEAGNFENLFKQQSRYPEITLSQIKSLQPELLFLSSEPFPFQQKHIDELQPHLPHTKIILVDGEMFSWYGSRLLHTPNYLMSLTTDIKKQFRL